MSTPLSVPAVADALDRARAAGRLFVSEDGEPPELDAATAGAVAEELYKSAAADRTWKLGALDVETQQRLGLDAPLVAPVLAAGLRMGALEVHLRRSDFLQPRLEPEVGVLDTGAGLQPVPCVEVADCRFPGWQVPRGWAVADFGLQGAMVFGIPARVQDVIRVEVLYDGGLLDAAERSWSDAVSRLDLLPPAARAAVPYTVATGAMTPLYDAAPGRWEFRFHGLSLLTLVIA